MCTTKRAARDQRTGGLSRIAARNRKIMLDGITGSAANRERCQQVGEWEARGYTHAQAVEIVTAHHKGLDQLRHRLLRQLETSNQAIEAKERKLLKLLTT
jgi:hypothetical protein